VEHLKAILLDYKITAELLAADASNSDISFSTQRDRVLAQLRGTGASLASMQGIHILSKLRSWRLRLKTLGRRRHGYGELVNEEEVYCREALEMEMEDSFSHIQPNETFQYPKMKHKGNQPPSAIDDGDDLEIGHGAVHVIIDADSPTSEIDNFDAELDDIEHSPKPLGVDVNSTPRQDLFDEIEKEDGKKLSLETLAEASYSYDAIPTIDFFQIPNTWGLFGYFIFYFTPLSFFILYHRDILMAILHIRKKDVSDSVVPYFIFFFIGTVLAALFLRKKSPVLAAKYMSQLTGICAALLLLARGGFFSVIFAIFSMVMGAMLAQISHFVVAYFHPENIRMGYVLLFTVLALMNFILTTSIESLRGPAGEKYYSAVSEVERLAITNTYNGVFKFLILIAVMTYFWTKYFARPLSEDERWEAQVELPSGVIAQHNGPSNLNHQSSLSHLETQQKPQPESLATRVKKMKAGQSLELQERDKSTLQANKRESGHNPEKKLEKLPDLLPNADDDFDDNIVNQHSLSALQNALKHGEPDIGVVSTDSESMMAV